MCNISNEDNNNLDNKYARIHNIEKERIKILNEELGWFDEEELNNTPRRVTKFYKEWAEDNQEFGFTSFNVDSTVTDSLVVLKDVAYHSMCAHHLLPFSGKAHVAYLPKKNGKVCGVSKLARGIIKFASMPQLQERMTNQIADFIKDKLEPDFVLVIVEGSHLCMKMRGVKQHTSNMVTSALRKNDESDRIKKHFSTIKDEAMTMIYGGIR